MENMIKFGTPVIDALRLCYVAEPSLLQDLSSLNVKSNRKFGDFTLTRVAADRFEYFFIISFDTGRARTELGSLKFGRYGAADSLYVYYQVQNGILYDRELLDQALCFPDLLGLYFNNFTAIDIALDHKKNISAIIKRMMRNEKITTILNGKAIKDRKELIKGLDFNFSSSLSRLHCQTITLKQAKAARNKSKGITIQSYDKKAEIEMQSGKDYILNHYGNPRHLFRLEVRLSYANLKGYFSKLGQPQTIASLFDTAVLEDLFFFSLSSVLRFSRGRKPFFRHIHNNRLLTLFLRQKNKHSQILVSA